MVVDDHEFPSQVRQQKSVPVQTGDGAQHVAAPIRGIQFEDVVVGSQKVVQGQEWLLGVAVIYLDHDVIVQP